MLAQKISYNIIVNALAKVLSIALALIGIGMLTRYLGTEGFGKYATVLAFFAFFSAVGDFGLYSIATREISRKKSDEQWILSRIFTLRLIISLSIFVLTVAFVWFLPYENDVKTGILVASGAFIFSSSYGLLNGLFQKHIAMDKVALIELSGKLIQVLVIISIIKLELAFIYTIIAIFIAMFWNFIFIFSLSKGYTKIYLKTDLSYWKSFLKESAPMGISAFVTFLYFKIDTILLSFFTTASDVGIYSAAYKIIETLTFFPAMIIGLVFPLFSRYIFSNKKKFIKISNIILKMFTLIIVPMIIVVLFLAPEIINIVGGSDYAESTLVLQILVFALASIFYGHLFTNILIAGSMQKNLMFALIIAAIINISANIILIPDYSYNGAAIVSVVTEVFVFLTTMALAIKYTPYKLSSIRLPFIIFSGLAMIIVFMTVSLNPFITSFIALTLYVLLLFIFRVITRNDIMHILPKRS
ncbi:MAG: flippase [Patescibacteria group bacterium]